MKTFKQFKEGVLKFKATNPTKSTAGYPEAEGIVGKIIKFSDIIHGGGVSIESEILFRGETIKNESKDELIKIIKKNKVKGFRFQGDFMTKEVQENKNLEYPNNLAKETGLVKSVGDYDASKFLLDVIKKFEKVEGKERRVLIHFIEV